MKKKEILDLKRRRNIFEFISQNPGLHMREISRKMNIPFSSLEYHLKNLEKKTLISPKEDGKYIRYFVSFEIGEKEKKILKFFQNKATLYIIYWFFIAVQCSQKDLARFIEKHPATIGFHLRNLKNADIIERVSINNGVINKDTLPGNIKRPQVSSEKIYVLKDPWMIYDLLIKHKESLVEKEIVTGLIEYVEFYISDGIPKQIQNREDTMDSVIRMFFDVFYPLSFCS